MNDIVKQWREMVVKHTNGGACNFQAAADDLVRERDADIERLRSERDEARNLAKQWSEDCGGEVLRLRKDVIDILSAISNQHRKIQQLNELLLKYQPKFDGSWLLLTSRGEEV